MTATAWDDLAMDRVEFSVGASVLATVTGPGPAYAVPLDTMLYTDGNHTLGCMAYDAQGNRSFTSVVIQIQNPPMP